jgi:heme/copper-type cytochrome/quinol oxidase subunit 2
MLYNDRVINTAKVEAALDQRGSRKGFSELMMKTTLILAFSFVISAALNFFLAIWVLKAPAGTPEFNEQLARMTALSYPVIVIPSLIVMMLAVWILIRGLRQLTGLEMDQIVSDQASGQRK